MAKKKRPLTKCDHSVEGCPERCAHKHEHPKDEHENCKRGICGGQHVECKEVA